MEFGWMIDAPAECRWCGAGGDVLEELVKRDDVIDPLLDALAVPARAGARAALSHKQKMKVADAHLEYLARAPSSAWYETPETEIAAAHLYRADLPDDARARIFPSVALEEELRAPVRAWLVSRGLAAADELPLGNKKADLVGRQAGGFLTDEHVVAVELKNRLPEYDRAFHQLSTYAGYAHDTYLACTPDFVAQVHWHHFNAKNVHRYDAGILEQALDRVGAGLLLVEGTRVTVARKPKRRKVQEAKLVEVRSALAARARALAAAASVAAGTNP